VKSKLVDEIRNAASKRSDLNLDIVSSMKYLKAVTDESIRIFPPILATFTRVVPSGGVSICGKYVPQGTVVGVNHWATYHSAKNFNHPDEFHPERWLENPPFEFANDSKDAMRPFSFGPRNCIGKNLAYVEMRIVLAKMLWHFDLRLKDESRDWPNQKVYLMWAKNPLMVMLTPVKRT